MSSDNEPPVTETTDHTDTEPEPSKQCRICFDGDDSELGKLIRPCLCKGSMSYVHVKCLQQWRMKSTSQKAFYSCDQCGYKYHFARTRIAGIATNSIVVGMLSVIFFTTLVVCSSFITTTFLTDDAQWSYAYTLYISPFEVMGNLIRTTTRFFIGDDSDRIILGPSPSFMGPVRSSADAELPSILKSLIRRFLLGLPVVGAGSIVLMFRSMFRAIPVPLQILRMRTRRLRHSEEITAIFALFAVLVGALQALYRVFKFTEKLVQRILIRAEDAILEVS